ncbi:hypothetical protein C7974DRAFT_299872 [Boeremia exigua]|uniref:uncharacterized protein n=1 Tax=Boeremia exigua TaxID=749465 RepID=UPI001E8DA6C7|nr:uncharacterized protein C7974DRAFT_299872 [Boeremia exigua]KAH6644492.1 hypothetical protein C7974DRAFT_299872 [Boeremia exigua]
MIRSAEPGELFLGIAANTIISIIILLVDIFYRLLHRGYKKLRTMQTNNTKPFPFEALPQELRDMVYRNLLEDVHYPSPAACQPASSLNGMFAGLWGSATDVRKTAQLPKASNWILLASKQIYAEYMDMLCKHGVFHLTVSPENYQPPTQNDRIWNVAPSTYKSIRKASLQLVTTSAMLGCTDPRNMESSSWDLAARIRSELSLLESCTHLTLNAKAIGDPLWNPLWIWYHSSQSFKNIGTSLSDHSTGPMLSHITFSLDTWSPGENYLERDGSNKGAWTWYCLKGHDVGLDGGPEQTVRDFCGMLYRECKTCRPAEEGEEEEE